MKIHLIEDNLLLPTTRNTLKQVKNTKLYDTIELQAVPRKDSIILLSDSTFYVTNVIYSENGEIYLLGVVNLDELNN